jgi:hypothetical protein
MRFLTRHEVNWYWTLDDEIVAALPEVSRHNEPQIGPQEYDCGCVTICRVTDRDYRRSEEPFEMHLAIKCNSDECELHGD